MPIITVMLIRLKRVKGRKTNGNGPIDQNKSYTYSGQLIYNLNGQYFKS